MIFKKNKIGILYYYGKPYKNISQINVHLTLIYSFPKF